MNIWMERFKLPEELSTVIEHSPSVIVPESKETLFELIFGSGHAGSVEVSYDVNGEQVLEATVARCRNGAVVNFPEDYMRRRDPDSMRVADGLPSDKPKFQDVYGYPFTEAREQTMDWLASQELILVPFKAGGYEYGYEALLVCPRNAAFFAMSLAQLQAFVSIKDVTDFTPRAIVYVAPPFRHTLFGGKQVVVHDRSKELHEVFSYNLYPGPSAKREFTAFLLTLVSRRAGSQPMPRRPGSSLPMRTRW